MTSIGVWKRPFTARGVAGLVDAPRTGRPDRHAPVAEARILALIQEPPHRLERYMASPDPDFERKAVAILGLYLNPPARASVFCVDEKTAIQAQDRLDPILPLLSGRAERHGFA